MPSVYRSRASAVCDSVTLTVPSKSVPPGGWQKAFCTGCCGVRSCAAHIAAASKGRPLEQSSAGDRGSDYFLCGGQVQSSGRSIPQEAAWAVKQASRTTAA